MMMRVPFSTAGFMAQPRPRQRWITAGAVLGVLLIAAGLSAWHYRTRIELHFGQAALDELEFHEADQWAQAVILRNPEDIDGLLLAARAAAGLRDTDRALALYDRIPDNATADALAARCESGDLLMERNHWMSAAEAQYRRVLAHNQHHRIANDRLAYLLSVASRRWEAIAPRITICRQDNFNPLHLKILAVGEGSFVEPKIVQRFHDGDPDDPAPLISMAWMALGDQELALAEELLQEAVALRPDLAEAQSMLASVLLQAGDDTGFLSWFGDLPDSARDHPGVWSALGRFAASVDQPEVAARCFWEAVGRNPNHHQANYQLGQVLTQLDREPEAKPFLERSRKINRYTTRVTAAWASERLGELKIVSEVAEELGLIWEAYGWALWAREKGNEESEPQAWAIETVARLAPRLASLEPKRTLGDANPVTTIDLADLPLPNWAADAPGQSVASRINDVNVSFEDQAQRAGVRFRYLNGGDPTHDGPGFMYEMTGGGGAAVDFDQDGWPDLFLPQGGVFDNRDEQQTDLDRLFHNTGNGFVDVTGQAGLISNGFGQGATVGDFDADGFPDILVANIGGNRLLTNNGDGTFSDVSQQAGITGKRWTTSCLLVDLNADGLPEVYAANFLSGDDVFTRECNQIRSPDQAEALDKGARGQSGTMRSGVCSPLDFPSSQDQLFLNLGDGRFREITSESGIVAPRGNGLGIVAADFSGSGQLSLFLANDSVPNFYFVHQGNTKGGLPRFRERALPLGLAVNQDGRAEACMGVATGDADGDGRLDLFVTNFLNQSNTLYRKLSEREFFTDITQRSGLHENSMGLLGWGTQFVDANLDGELDLVVTNGHVEDFPDNRTLYEMPAQYLHNTGGGRFVELKADRVGEFFHRHVLGRGMARLDWNRDGLNDVLISHMDAPVALLTCTSANHGHYVAIRLRATGSARDAIGTQLTLSAGGRKLYRQQTAGDGYMASNQRQLIFGTGDVSAVGPLEVRWPSGRVDTFTGVPIDCELMLVEGRQPTRVPR
ncbi:MAG: hypothetical protein CMJ69_20010 [Planctomycetaceae bacterium]|nr:hypothetical protein [Planctomycetaceae bacterium]